VTRRLHRHPKALADVEESAVYIGADNPEATLRFLGAVEATLRLLVRNPDLGPARRFERSDLVGLRSFPVKASTYIWSPTERSITESRSYALCTALATSGPSSTSNSMNDTCRSCGAELPPSPPGSKRRPCPDCGETVRVIQATVHAVAGAATCEAKGIVIRPDPAVLELRVPDVEVVLDEPPEVARPPRGRALMARRNAAHYVLLDDIRREEDDSPILDYLVERLETLRDRMRREAENGNYDG